MELKTVNPKKLKKNYFSIRVVMSYSRSEV